MTTIEWTRGDDGTQGKSWNPCTGCTPVSEGCAHCYAQRMARRLAGRAGYPEHPDHFRVTLHPEKLDEPLRWRKPRRVFVCSMSDLFHEDVPEDFVLDVFARAIALTEHTFIFLTKRPERMCDIVSRRMPGLWQWPNIWGMVTAENQKWADERIPWLLKTPFAVRGVSYEPALGPVDFQDALFEFKPVKTLAEDGCDYVFDRRQTLHWIIAGGETGPGARPAHPDWFRSVRDQCQAAGVPFFFKGWGEWYLYDSLLQPRSQMCWLDIRGKANPTYSAMMQEPQNLYRIGKKRADRLLDGRLWEEWPTC